MEDGVAQHSGDAVVVGVEVLTNPMLGLVGEVCVELDPVAAFVEPDVVIGVVADADFGGGVGGAHGFSMVGGFTPGTRATKNRLSLRMGG